MENISQICGNLRQYFLNPNSLSQEQKEDIKVMAIYALMLATTIGAIASTARTGLPAGTVFRALTLGAATGTGAAIHKDGRRDTFLQGAAKGGLVATTIVVIRKAFTGRLAASTGISGAILGGIGGLVTEFAEREMKVGLRARATMVAGTAIATMAAVGTSGVVGAAEIGTTVAAILAAVSGARGLVD